METQEYHRRRGRLAPDPEMWAALREGEMMMEILSDFYTRVYRDARLAHFFEGVTRQRAIEKQYLFLRAIFTGERIYFGDHPRNAHHWMVISEELFDYREALMERCLRDHGLPDHLVLRWRSVEEVFRRAIVKDAPRPRKIGGVEIPAEGYSEAELSVGSLCDGCGVELAAGTHCRYHVRTGKTYCVGCFSTSEKVGRPEALAGSEYDHRGMRR